MWAAAAVAALSSCGGSAEPVKPTPRSEFRSTYPCELLTRAMAERLVSRRGLVRAGAQSSDSGEEQCLWAASKHNWTPGVTLVIYPDEEGSPGGTFEDTQRRAEQSFAKLRRSGYKAGVGVAYRVLHGLGDRAYLESYGRSQAGVKVQRGGRSFWLTMRLKQRPRSQPPPLDRLVAVARDIAARFDPPAVKLRGRLRDIARSS